MDEDQKFKPFNRYRFQPDYTKIQGKLILIVLIAVVIFGIVFVLSYY